MRNTGFIILGPPGAGKGTQAEILSQRLNLLKVSTGDILREAVSKGTELGKLAESYMNRGELVPDDIMLSLVEETLKGKDGFILDGFPRTINQAKGLEDILRKLGMEIKAVILLDVSDEEIVRRLSSRRVCIKCGAVYNMITSPPKIEGVCDRCGSELVIRSDDEPDTIRKRLEVYRRETAPLIDYYRKKGLLKEVNGTGDLKEVTEKLVALLNL
jgi:adenylate kinase